VRRFAISLTTTLLFVVGSSGLAAGQEGDPVAGKNVFKSCTSCHQVGEGAKNRVGPVLTGVIGRPAGSFEGYKYGKGLKAANEKGLVWTRETVFEWLANPKNFLRDYLGDKRAKAKMSFRMKDEQKRRDVIAYLESLTEEKSSGMMMNDVSHGDTKFSMSVLEEAPVVEDPTAGMQRVKQQLVKPPFAPEHDQVAAGQPKVVEVELVVEEKSWVLDGDGTEIVALTFNGSIPAPMIVVHEGDYVELTLKNPASNVMEHNIDLHAATGALGGAAVTTISPGQQAVLRFKATKTGAFLYHCAPEGSMTPYHVTHGMTGAIMVLPRDGLKDEKGERLSYDKLYYVGENDFYVPRDENGDFKSYSEAGEDLADWIESMKT